PAPAHPAATPASQARRLRALPLEGPRIVPASPPSATPRSSITDRPAGRIRHFFVAKAGPAVEARDGSKSGPLLAPGIRSPPIEESSGVQHRRTRYGRVHALPRHPGRTVRAAESSGPRRIRRDVGHRQGPGDEPGPFPDRPDGPDDGVGPDEPPRGR